MTTAEKREAVAAKYRTIIGRNIYSQSLRDYCFKPYRDGKYYSDCSSSISYSYKAVGFPFGILNTVGMYSSKKFEAVPVKITKGQITNPELLRVGDMLLFAGSDKSRARAGYVGHVEMVGEIEKSGKVWLYGHGSGTPKRHEMKNYLRVRYNNKTSTKVGNKGLIKVVRFLTDEIQPAPEPVRKQYTTVTRKAVRVTGATVNVRKNPSTGSSVLGYARAREVYDLREAPENAMWFPVTYKGQPAWISKKWSVLTEISEQIEVVEHD